MPKFFTKNQDENEDNNDPDLIKTYLSWKAPARPFRKKDRSYYTTIAILVILLILVALLMREILLIGVLLAIAFVAYVLGFVPPEEIEFKISTQGITIGDHFYLWADLNSFWFAEKEGQKVLHVLTYFRFPGELMLVLGPSAGSGQENNEEEIKKVVAKYLPYHEIAPKSLMDKWSESLQKHFPLENPHK